jgi:hypothetical protein
METKRRRLQYYSSYDSYDSFDSTTEDSAYLDSVFESGNFDSMHHEVYLELEEMVTSESGVTQDYYFEMVAIATYIHKPPDLMDAIWQSRDGLMKNELPRTEVIQPSFHEVCHMFGSDDPTPTPAYLPQEELFAFIEHCDSPGKATPGDHCGMAHDMADTMFHMGGDSGFPINMHDVHELADHTMYDYMNPTADGITIANYQCMEGLLYGTPMNVSEARFHQKVESNTGYMTESEYYAQTLGEFFMGPRSPSEQMSGSREQVNNMEVQHEHDQMREAVLVTREIASSETSKCHYGYLRRSLRKLEETSGGRRLEARDLSEINSNFASRRLQGLQGESGEATYVELKEALEQCPMTLEETEQLTAQLKIGMEYAAHRVEMERERMDSGYQNYTRDGGSHPEENKYQRLLEQSGDIQEAYDVMAAHVTNVQTEIDSHKTNAAGDAYAADFQGNGAFLAAANLDTFATASAEVIARVVTITMPNFEQPGLPEREQINPQMMDGLHDAYKQPEEDPVHSVPSSGESSFVDHVHSLASEMGYVPDNSGGVPTTVFDAPPPVVPITAPPMDCEHHQPNMWHAPVPMKRRMSGKRGRRLFVARDAPVNWRKLSTMVGEYYEPNDGGAAIERENYEYCGDDLRVLNTGCWPWEKTIEDLLREVFEPIMAEGGHSATAQKQQMMAQLEDPQNNQNVAPDVKKKMQIFLGNFFDERSGHCDGQGICDQTKGPGAVQEEAIRSLARAFDRDGYGCVAPPMPQGFDCSYFGESVLTTFEDDDNDGLPDGGLLFQMDYTLECDLEKQGQHVSLEVEGTIEAACSFTAETEAGNAVRRRARRMAAEDKVIHPQLRRALRMKQDIRDIQGRRLGENTRDNQGRRVQGDGDFYYQPNTGTPMPDDVTNSKFQELMTSNGVDHQDMTDLLAMEHGMDEDNQALLHTYHDTFDDAYEFHCQHYHRDYTKLAIGLNDYLTAADTAQQSEILKIAEHVSQKYWDMPTDFVNGTHPLRDICKSVVVPGYHGASGADYDNDGMDDDGELAACMLEVLPDIPPHHVQKMEDVRAGRQDFGRAFMHDMPEMTNATRVD